MRGYSILRAPSVLGLRQTGVERAPEALLRLGLAERLGAEVVGEVKPGPYAEKPDAVTGIRNSSAIVSYTHHLAERVEEVLDRGRIPVVLGGDCSILLGGMLALRRRGRYGLLFIDGHADFYQPEANVNGEAASSELAFATGRGPETLTRFDGFRPLVADEDTVVVGRRDADESAAYGSQPLASTIREMDLKRVRDTGIDSVAARAVEHLSRSELDGFWVHFDADVLNDELMPAVDYRLPDGLTWEETERLLGVASGERGLMGLDLTIYNPDLDPGGIAGRALVAILSGALHTGRHEL